MHGVFLGHQHTYFMAQRMEAALVEFAGGGVLLHHQRCEVDDVGKVEGGIGKGFRREQPFGAEFGLLGTKRPQTHRADIVDMADREKRGQVHDIGVAGGAVAVAQPGNSGPWASPSMDQVRAPERSPPLNFGSSVVAV